MYGSDEVVVAGVGAVRCLIIDDSSNFRDAAREMLERSGIDVVGMASSVAEGVRRFTELEPDVTLVDVDLGAESGFDLVEQLDLTGAGSPIILISTHSEQDFSDLIAASPAVGFLPKFALSPDAIRRLVDASVTPGT